MKEKLTAHSRLDKHISTQTLCTQYNASYTDIYPIHIQSSVLHIHTCIAH